MITTKLLLAAPLGPLMEPCHGESGTSVALHASGVTAANIDVRDGYSQPYLLLPYNPSYFPHKQMHNSLLIDSLSVRL